MSSLVLGADPSDKGGPTPSLAFCRELLVLCGRLNVSGRCLPQRTTRLLDDAVVSAYGYVCT